MCSGAIGTPVDRPNFIFILSDDQGSWALGCAGNDDIRTPHLDALAVRGTRLENFFCVSPVCSPARASLLTGAIPSRHGVHDYLDGHEVGVDGIDYLAGQRTYFDALAENGYRIGLTGKWHLGANDKARSGFAHWFALEGGSSDYHRASMYRDGRTERVMEYLTDALAADGIAFLEDAQKRAGPFFLSLHFTAPHKPWKGQHPERFASLYKDSNFTSCPQEKPHPWLATRNGVAIAGEEDTKAALVGYFAAITAMDDAIGRIMAQLTELGLEEDTVVIFTSDNGFNCGHHGIWGKGNGTFPQNLYDTSVKVPMIVSQPGRIGSGRVVHDLLSAYDVASTLLQLAGLDASEFESGPGQSFASLLLAGRREMDARPVVVYDEYGPVRMIRTHAWKYIHRYPHGPDELFDLTADPGETVNQSANPDHASRITDMRNRMHSWFAEHGVMENDGSALPVTGGGQINPISEGPLNAFAARGAVSAGQTYRGETP